MKFLQELNESRLYRKLEQMQGQNTNDVAKRMFLHFVALQIMYHEAPQVVQSYANSMLNRQQFDGFRTSQPDLWNLITVLLNQDRYEYVVSKRGTITLPEMRIKRNLRDLAAGRMDNNDFSHLMMILQREISGLDSNHVTLRRRASEWDRLSDRERKQTIKLLFRVMQEYTFNSDLHQKLRTVSKI